MSHSFDYSIIDLSCSFTSSIDQLMVLKSFNLTEMLEIDSHFEYTSPSVSSRLVNIRYSGSLHNRIIVLKSSK